MRDNDLQGPLRISPQFSVHVVDDRQVLLLSEQRSFRLSGKLYVALLPYLDGSRDEDEIVRALGRVPEDPLRGALHNMIAKGYVCAVDRMAPTSRQAIWVELELAPAQAERALAQQSIAVVTMPGSPAVAEAARLLSEAALATGFSVATEDTAALTVICVADYLHRDLKALNTVMRQTGRAWLPFKPGGSMPLLGPLFRPGKPTCWACVAERMLENRPGDRLVEPTVKTVRPALAYTASSLGLAVNFAALEMARTVALDGAEGLERRIVSLELKSYERREHFVRPDPACTVCGEPYDALKTLEEASAPLQLQSRPVLSDSDGGWRVSAAEDVVKRLSRYVSPVTGIIADVTDTSPQADLPVFQARQTNPVATSPRENRLLGRPGAAAGKGVGRAQAQASCLAEAIERHLCGFTGREPRRRAMWADVAEEAPHPCTFLNYSERQYNQREEWNKSNSGFNWVGERFDESRAIEWTPAWSLTHGKRRWLPMRYCYFRYHDQAVTTDDEENKFCAGDSNGCASGSTVEEAILQGFLELVERDACALWWYSRVRRPAFDLEAMDSPFVRRAHAYCARSGRGLHVLDLTNDLAIPAAIAVSYNQATGKGIALGLGAHFDSDIAIGRALAEMNQMLTLEGEVGKLTDGHKLTGDNQALVDWTLNHSLETDPYCVPDGMVRSGLHPRPAISDLKDAVELCMRRVADKGFEMIVLDHSRPEIDFAAARVVVPGLRHFWARLREGRLYDAPVHLGWVEKPLDEETVNPMPFFLEFTVAGPVHLLHHFNADVQSVRRKGNQMVLDVKDWKPIGFAPAQASHADAIAALEGRGSTLLQLVQIAIGGGDAELGEKAIHYYLDRFAFGRLLGWTIVDSEGELARVHALAKLYAPRRDPLPANPVALSRFAYLRRVEETMVLESGLMRARIELRPRGLALLGAILGEPCKAASESLANALWQLGFFEAVDAEELAAQRCWQFHDLVLHEASRANCETIAVGGTYRFDGSIPPMPAVRPAHSGKLVRLPTLELESVRQRSRSLDALQAARKSIRDYAASPLSLEMLGEFLWRVCRTTEYLPLQRQDLLSRPYPAGGSIHELEFYVAAHRCSGLRPSVHHYDSHGHALVELEASQKVAARIVEACGRAMALETGRLLPAAAIVVTSRLPRLAWKYEGMAYRASLMNTGVVYHLMYMVATDMGLAPCATGTGDSRLLEEAAGLDRLQETPIGEFALGIPATAEVPAAASSDWSQ